MELLTTNSELIRPNELEVVG